jgi:hypothetical protein
MATEAQSTQRIIIERFFREADNGTFLSIRIPNLKPFKITP